MTEKELRRLSRADLLEMLIDQSRKLQKVQKRLKNAEAELAKRDYAINNAGSIAEAALQLSGIFEAAQISCENYTENIRMLSERQESICDQIERESMEKAARYMQGVQKKCAAMEEETKLRCAEMLASAEREAESYWQEVSKRLDAYYEEHAGIRELLGIAAAKIGRKK